MEDMDFDDSDSNQSSGTLASLTNMFTSSTQPYVKKLLGWKQGDEEDKWAEKAVEALVKRLSKKNKAGLDELNMALKYQGRKPSQCVTIQRSLDGRLQVSHRKGLPHVIYCRVWRWPDLQTHHELKPTDDCRYPFNAKQKDVCINPFHYKRVEHNGGMPPVVVPRCSERPPLQHLMQFQQQQQQQQQMQNNYNYAAGSPYSSMSPASSGGQSPYSVNFMAESPPPSYSPNDDGRQSSFKFNCNAPSPSLYQKPECWASIVYYELNSKVGEAFSCGPNLQKVIVDGFTNPAGANFCHDRFCLGQLSNVNRNSTIENTRRHIGKGIQLTFNAGLTVTCLSDSAIFVQSLEANSRLELHESTVLKVTTGFSVELFNMNSFSELLYRKYQEGYEAVFGLTKFCTIRLSFVKGWGSMYHRQDITSTPCWIEIHFHEALKMLDMWLQNMEAPPKYSITSRS